MNAPLPQTLQTDRDESHLTAFRDVAECRRWLAGLPAASPALALATLREGIAPLAASGMPVAEMRQVLELVHEPVEKLHALVVPAFSARPMPLSDDELAVWNNATGAWLALASAYHACIDGCRGMPPGSSTEAFLGWRLQQCLGEVLLDHARAYTEPPEELWQLLNTAYREAEQREVATVPVGAGGVPGTPAATCQSVFLATLLLRQAQTCALAPDRIEDVARWIRNWSDGARLRAEPAEPRSLSALAIDLASAEPLRLARQVGAGALVRHLDTERLGQRLRALAQELREGRGAHDLGLGAGVSPHGLDRLLTTLYVQWCSAGTGRAAPRSEASMNAMVTLTVPAMHYYISGRPFRQPGQPPSREELEDLATFGHISLRTTRKLVSQRSSAMEPWSIVNHSVSGMLVLVRKPDFRTRIEHGQALGMMSGADRPIEMVTVRRLRSVPGTGLEVGVQRIPGLPRAAAVRRVSAGTSTDKFERALYLIADDAGGPPTLVLQRDWFRPGQALELHVDETRRIRLTRLIDQGPNFEWAEFETVGAAA